MNDLHVLHSYESDEALTLSISSNNVSVPSGYIAPIALWLVIDSERVELPQVLPEQLPYYSTNAQPRFWAVDASKIRFDSPSDAAYSAKFRMLKSSNLSVSSTTNALLTKRPDLYLAACMVEACRFTGNRQMFSMYEAKFQQGINELKASDSRAHSRVTLRTELGRAGRPNILTDG